MAEINLEELDSIIEKHKDRNGKLIPVLHEVQEKVGYLPLEVQKYISKKLTVPLSRIYGVVSFYSFFSINPKGDHTIGVCMGTACYVKGAEDILDNIKAELGCDTGETSEDNRFTITITRCLGTCSIAPVIMIDDKVYGHVTKNQVPKILAEY